MYCWFHVCRGSVFYRVLSLPINSLSITYFFLPAFLCAASNLTWDLAVDHLAAPQQQHASSLTPSIRSLSVSYTSSGTGLIECHVKVAIAARTDEHF